MASLDEFIGKTVGVLGGGQLGKMMSAAAHRLGLRVCVMDSSPDCPCAGFVDKLLVGSVGDPQQVLRFKEEGLKELENQGVRVFPTSDTLRIIQDKFIQHQFLQNNHIAVTEFMEVNTADQVRNAVEKLGLPLLLKARKQSYDGRGNFVLKTVEDIEVGMKKLGSADLYAEKFVPFIKELSVMVSVHHNPDHSSFFGVSYPVVETVHSDNICTFVIAPAGVSEEIRERALEVATRAATSFGSRGIFGVEMFLLENGEVLVNEIAPRPHNSGHYTIEACSCSQFEEHLRSILGMIPGNPDMIVNHSVMVNILGAGEGPEGMKLTLAPINKALSAKGATAHWYGKKEVRSQRKMGHITVVGDNLSTIGETLSTWNLTDFTKVGIIMGSDSDLPKMKAAAEVLKKFGVPFELTIVSAHRTPERMMEYANTAHKRGIKVIIAGAGGAAHLPGMVAAVTPLPVIGVPVSLSVLDGQDSLLSIVQMPRGVPVATVAINNSTNAGLLAVRILGSGEGWDTGREGRRDVDGATKDKEVNLLHKVSHYREEMKEEVMTKVDRLAEVGWENY